MFRWPTLDGAQPTGLIALTGGRPAPIGRLLGDGQDDAAETRLQRLRRCSPAGSTSSCMRHGLPAEERIEPRLIDLAYEHDLPLVATNEVYFADRDDVRGA